MGPSEWGDEWLIVREECGMQLTELQASALTAGGTDRDSLLFTHTRSVTLTDQPRQTHTLLQASWYTSTHKFEQTNPLSHAHAQQAPINSYPLRPFNGSLYPNTVSLTLNNPEINQRNKKSSLIVQNRLNQQCDNVPFTHAQSRADAVMCHGMDGHTAA